MIWLLSAAALAPLLALADDNECACIGTNEGIPKESELFESEYGEYCDDWDNQYDFAICGVEGKPDWCNDNWCYTKKSCTFEGKIAAWRSTLFKESELYWSYEACGNPNRLCEPRQKPIDIYFAVDSSGSVDEEEWFNVRFFLSKLIEYGLDMEEDRVGITVWSSDRAVKYRFEDGKEFITEDVMNMEPIRGGTRTDKAISHALEQLKKEEKKDGHQQVIVLITDAEPDQGSGPCTDGDKSIRRKLNNAGVLFGVLAISDGKDRDYEGAFECLVDDKEKNIAVLTNFYSFTEYRDPTDGLLCVNPSIFILPDRTLSPTIKPTDGPTMKPSPMPTRAPTRKPTERPTEMPTPKPTVKPTEMPTRKPTEKPSELPSFSPTRSPTDKPSELPSNAPTRSPTDRPSELPSLAPSREPTDRPTQTPSLKPTKEPTYKPTMKPSDEPTMGTPAPTECIPEDPKMDVKYKKKCGKKKKKKQCNKCKDCVYAEKEQKDSNCYARDDPEACATIIHEATCEDLRNCEFVGGMCRPTAKARGGRRWIDTDGPHYWMTCAQNWCDKHTWFGGPRQCHYETEFGCGCHEISDAGECNAHEDCVFENCACVEKPACETLEFEQCHKDPRCAVWDEGCVPKCKPAPNQELPDNVTLMLDHTDGKCKLHTVFECTKSCNKQ